MQILIPREREPGETRVAASPETVGRLTDAGHSVRVETGAGVRASFPDDSYTDAGAELVEELGEAWANAEVVAKVAPPSAEEVAAMSAEGILVGFCAPHRAVESVAALRDRQVSALAMELLPRITRAQSMDALSSQASIAGYRAALVASVHLDKLFPLMMTAAGTIQPAKVVVMGAGVAGLQALATCRRLGATVEVSDIRPEVKEQVASLGGRFIDLPLEESGAGEGGYAKEMGEDFLKKQRALVAERIAQADAVITTANIPGRPAPRLIEEDVVARMRPGAVIVDLAVETGGNCALSVAGETVERHGVIIVGPVNVPASGPRDASLMYARNVLALLTHLEHEGAPRLDLEDEILGAMLLTHAGEVRHAPTRALLEGDPS